MALVDRGMEMLPPVAVGATGSPQTQVWLGWRRVNQAKPRFDLEEKDTLDTPLPSQPLRKLVKGKRMGPRNAPSLILVLHSQSSSLGPLRL